MLKRVSIQNFKSLKDVTLDLQKVNLLIGPNNSGKTNFLKALEFCYNAHDFIEIEDEDSEYPRSFLMYEIIGDHSATSFKKDKNNTITLKLIISEANLEREAEINWSNDKSLVTHSSNDNDPSFSDEIDTVKTIKEALGVITIYKPDPNKLDKPAPVGMGARTVNSDTSNIIAFFDYIRDEQPQAFTQIKADLAKCVPEFTEINFQSVKPTDELLKIYGPATYKRIGLTNSRQNIIYWADELSEGTLYFIALLCIIHQPNPPKLLLLEEPEKGIHPRRIREVMDFIFRLAEEKDIQIILTTHNEHVLDDFATRPESVFVFDKDEEGATYVRNLQTDIIEPTNKRNRELGLDEVDLTTNLSENWLYGLLGGVPSIP